MITPITSNGNAPGSKRPSTSGERTAKNVKIELLAVDRIVRRDSILVICPSLSEQRANSVKDYLVNTAGIGDDRIVTLWFGEINPAADNATEEGRQRNRRVEIAVGGVQ